MALSVMGSSARSEDQIIQTHTANREGSVKSSIIARTGTETLKTLIILQFTQGSGVETEIGTPRSLEIRLRAGAIC